MTAVSRPTLLVVDDDAGIRDLLGRYLADHGFHVVAAADGVGMRRLVTTSAIDLVVLDLMLPGEDGMSLCRWLRAESTLPVIILTARAEQTERVVGLELGADDYVTKPFDPRELVARIRAVLRRLTRTQGVPGTSANEQRYLFDGWRFSVSERVLLDPLGRQVDLSSGEFELLQAFVENPRRVLGRDHLLDRTRGREFIAFDRSIDVQVSRLRRKLGREGAETTLIRTVRGAGYVFTARVMRE